MNLTRDILEKSSVLIVDDTPANLKVLSGMLKEKGYEVRPVPNGKLALQAARNKIPDLILLDINMPDMNGYEVCERLKKEPLLKDVPVIFISALSETLDKIKAFSVGGIDYITKPFQLEEVHARVETHLKLRKLMVNLENIIEEKVEEIYSSQVATIFAMAKLTQSRDDATGKHLNRVSNYCRLIVTKLSQQDKYKGIIDAKYIELVTSSSILHDIGKVGIPDEILLKPGKLSENEFELMKKHTVIGADTFMAVKRMYPQNEYVSLGVEIARSHHEKWNGNGYPDGLAGSDIPLAARIMSIADIYDALKSERCYKKEYPHEKCCEIINEGRGIIFDPDIVDVFNEVNEEIYSIWKSMY